MGFGAESAARLISADLISAGPRYVHRLYKRLVSAWVLYDNSRAVPTLIEGEDNP